MTIYEALKAKLGREPTSDRSPSIMSYPTKSAAIASLREFSPAVRARHAIVRFWSTKHNAWRYGRDL